MTLPMRQRARVGELLQQRPSGHRAHRHIVNAHQRLVSVGIGGTAAAPGEILTVEQIRDAIAAGESFYTYSASTQRVAFVHFRGK